MIASIYTPICATVVHRPLIVILDSCEETIAHTLNTCTQIPQDNNPAGIGALSYTFITACDQSAAPIIVSKNIFDSICTHAQIFTDFVNLDLPTLYKKYKQFNRFSNEHKINQFKECCTYAYTTYKNLEKQLKSAFSSDTQADIYKLLKELTTDPAYSCKKAPVAIAQHVSDKNSKKKYQEIGTYIMCWRCLHLLNNWVIKQVKNSYYILIDKAYLSKIYNEKATYTYMPEQTKLTALELALGIKINHLPDYKINRAMQLSTKTIYSSPDVVKHLKNIFVTNGEIHHSRVPLWTIYILGHGSPSEDLKNELNYIKHLEHLYKHISSTEYKSCIKAQESNDEELYCDHLKNCDNHDFYLQQQQLIKYVQAQKAWLVEQIRYQTVAGQGTIASCSLSQFTQLLLFLNNDINTHLLFYSSCYAGGEHLIKPYKIDNQPLLLNYPVVVGALAESKTQQQLPMLYIPPYDQKQVENKTYIYGIIPAALDIKKKKLALVSSLHFNNFFQQSRSLEIHSIKHIEKLILSIHSYNLSINNIPCIRYPGSSTFKPLLSDEKADIITEQRPQADNKSLDIKQPLVLLGTNVINQSLYLHTLPVFVTGSCKPQAYIFSYIQAPEYTFLDIINTIAASCCYQTAQIWCIKKLICKKTMGITPLTALITTPTMTLYDVIITHNCITTESISALIENSDTELTGENLTVLPEGEKYAYFTLKVGDNTHAFKLSWHDLAESLDTLSITKCENNYYKKELEAHYNSLAHSL